MKGYFMTITSEEKALDRLQKAHDDLKQCRFRTTSALEDLGEYVVQLWELSDAWSNFCWRVQREESKQKMLKNFCYWIHDYNSVVGNVRNRRDVGVARYWFPYFEAMLNVTHVFLESGDLSVFYNPYVYAENKNAGKGGTVGERWCLVTSEMCGIESSELPRYFPVTLPLCTNSEKMKTYFLEKRWYGFRDISIEQRLKYYEDWEHDLKPVLNWINENLVSKSAKESGIVSNLNFAAQT